jgi:hypothetical protein
MALDTTPLVLLGMFLAGAVSDTAAGQAPTTEGCSAMTALPAHIRLTSCVLAKAVAAGLEGSLTFRRLADRIAALDGIVHVDARYVVRFESRQVLSGALLHRVTRAGKYRLLHITVAPEAGTRPVLTMAHELQHAIEVLESNAMTEGDIERLFTRIGIRVGPGTFETDRALELERAVARELMEALGR